MLLHWSILVLVSSFRPHVFLSVPLVFLPVEYQAIRVVICFLVLLVTWRFCYQCPGSFYQSSPKVSLTDYFVDEVSTLFLDLNEAVPETERLDSKALKTRAQLSVKNRRQRPTRTRLYDSVSSTDGEDSLERKVRASRPVLCCIIFLIAYWK